MPHRLNVSFSHFFMKFNFPAIEKKKKKERKKNVLNILYYRLYDLQIWKCVYMNVKMFMSSGNHWWFCNSTFRFYLLPVRSLQPLNYPLSFIYLFFSYAFPTWCRDWVYQILSIYFDTLLCSLRAVANGWNTFGLEVIKMLTIVCPFPFFVYQFPILSLQSSSPIAVSCVWYRNCTDPFCRSYFSPLLILVLSLSWVGSVLIGLLFLYFWMIVDFLASLAAGLSPSG